MTIQFDFDKVIDRRGTGSEKWEKYAHRDVIPMWVADMDFQSPPAVLAALHEQVDHGIFGYANPTAELVEVVLNMLRANYDWEVDASWLVWLPGLVTGLNISCRAVGTDSKDEVMSFVPIYPPFLTAPVWSQRKLKTVPLRQVNDRWVMDFDAFEEAISEKTRLLLFCNPQNPVGRVFERQELERLCEICLRHQVVICSDEIHCDLILDDLEHIATATLSEEVAQNTITLIAPSKTYNIAGLGCSIAVIPNERLRKSFQRVRRGIVPWVTGPGYRACLAAYRDSESWRQGLLDYLRENRDIVRGFVNEHLAGLTMSHVEATYLAWIDARKLGLEDAGGFFEAAGVGLSDGRYFQGDGFLRLNFGCPRETLMEGLNRMQKGLEKLQREKKNGKVITR
ncbi:MAG: putative C-S lyase [Planctomycetes bacterium]|nr:putative C-S lyase [Planctomycetota bacterium]